MTRGTITISIDLELAWGNWDNLSASHVAHIEEKERPIVARLVKLLDRHELAVTWALVAALLDPKSAEGRPGGEHLWYAPDVIEFIRSAKVRHDFGSHGGRHIYLDEAEDSEAEDDLAFARSIHGREGLGWGSFVFPRNRIGRKSLLTRNAVRVYRGTDNAWHQRIRNRQPLLGRAANLADKMLPITPETVRPEADGAMINLPGSLLFFGREGVRRFASPQVMRAKLAQGLAAARLRGEVFHLWFHPSNFWHDTERQFEILSEFAQNVANSASKNEVDVRPMAAFA